MAAGLTASSIIYPTDILRQFMNNYTKGHISIWGALKTIVSEYGFRHFYKGFPNFCIVMGIYRGCYNGTYDTNKGKAKNLWQKAGIAYCSTILSEGVVFPFEIIRRRRILTNSTLGLLQYARKVLKEEGIRGFYRGSPVLPFQSITWAIVLIIFDTAGINSETIEV